MFQNKLWNKRQAVIGDHDRTANSAEGYNQQLKNVVSKGENLWTDVNYVMKEESLVAIQVGDTLMIGQDSSLSEIEKEREERTRELK